MKYLSPAFLILCLFIAGCVQGQTSRQTVSLPSNQVPCPVDTKICPDGSFVSRSPPSCDFDACPPSDDSFCDYGSPYRDYKGKDQAMCARIKYACPDGAQSFSDHCGCGCTTSYTPPDLQGSKVTNN